MTTFWNINFKESYVKSSKVFLSLHKGIFCLLSGLSKFFCIWLSAFIDSGELYASSFFAEPKNRHTNNIVNIYIDWQTPGNVRYEFLNMSEWFLTDFIVIMNKLCSQCWKKRTCLQAQVGHYIISLLGMQMHKQELL